MLANGPDQQCNSFPWSPSTQSQQRFRSSPSRCTPHKPGHQLPVVSNGAHTTVLLRRVGEGGLHCRDWMAGAIFRTAD